MHRPCSASIVRSELPDHRDIRQRRHCVRPQFSGGNVNGVQTRGWRQCQPPFRAHVPWFSFRVFVKGRCWCHKNLEQDRFATRRTTGPCVEGSRGASGGARHQDIGHPDRPPRTCSQILGHFVRRASDLVEPDPSGRRRASSFAPPGSLCGGEGDMFVAVCRPRGSGTVRWEARPGHVGVLEFHSARQSRGLGRRNEGLRPVASVLGKFGFPQCQRQRGALGRTGCPRSWSDTQMSLASWWDSWSTRQTFPDRSTLSLGAPETGGNMKRLFALRRRSERRVCSQDG